MKKLALAAALAAVIAAPAFAAEEGKMEVKKETTTSTVATKTEAKTEAKPLELKAGGWVKVDEKNNAMVSKDEGKTWSPAPDGTHELKTGEKVETKGGVVQKKS